MKSFANTVATVFSHHRAMVLFHERLYLMTNITQSNSWSNRLDTNFHGLIGQVNQPNGFNGRFADMKHLAGITMETILDDGNINI